MAAPAAFSRKSWVYAVNGWRLFQQQSRFKVGFISLFALCCVVGLWELFLEGFQFLDKFGGLAGLIMGRLFSLFYLGMGLMLVMSGVVTSYATLYRSEEVPYLLVRPLPLSQVVVYKFLESAYFSSWAFLFVMVPFAGAYAMHERLTLLFGLWTALYSVPFLVVCAGIGALFIMACVRWWPRRLHLKPMLLAVALLVGWGVWRSSSQFTEDDSGTFMLSALIPGVQVASNTLLPSTWVAEGILSASRGEWGRAALFLGMILSTAAALIVLVEWLGTATFHDAWERVQEGGGRTGRPSLVFRVADRALWFLPGDLRALIMKDVRTFFRDPMQWSQVLIFFGLLGMYFANLRRFHYHTYSAEWRSLVCFLNVFSVSAVLCSLGSRFIYPQLSLEGQGFWLLGLSPTSMRRIMLAKFLQAVGATGAVSVLLVGLSSSMLRVEPAMIGASLGVIACVVLAISGLSTGLGAVFMDLRQRNPAAIVGGFGGTVNLVLSLGFMLAVVLPFGVLFHLHITGALRDSEFRTGAWLSAAWCLGLTALAVGGSMALGLRSLRRRDY